MKRQFGVVILSAPLALSACSHESHLVFAARVHASAGGVLLTISIPSGQTWGDTLRVFTTIQNVSAHTVLLRGYPAACADGGDNPLVLVLDDAGRRVYPPTAVPRECPYPLPVALAPGGVFRRTVTVHLTGTWLQGHLLLTHVHGGVTELNTRRLRVQSIPNS